MNEKITLNSPIKIDGILTDEVTMREPCVDDMLAARKGGKSPEETELVLFANLLEITPETIRSLSLRDYKRIQNAFSKLTSEEGESFLV